MMRGRNVRGRAAKGRLKGEDEICLDYKKNVQDTVNNLFKEMTRVNSSKSRKLSCYNAFVRLWFRIGSSVKLTYTKEELAVCLRQGLFSPHKEIRAACLRSFRYFCHDCDSLSAMLKVHVDYLVARSLDICVDNEVERVQAVRLIRKIMSVCPKHFPPSLLTVLISIANDGMKERDKLVKSCLATICELALCNAKLVVKHGGLSTLLDNTLHCHQQPRINESLMATVLYLINYPSTRSLVKADMDLEMMLAPFTDFDFKYGYESNEQPGEESEFKFDSCKMAVATVMKSWPGIMWMCKPNGSGLRSLIGMLFLPNMETRKEIMDVLFDVFRLPVPIWTDNVTHALLSTDPSEMNDKWRLGDGFVAEEGKALLPYRSKTRPNLVDNHAAFLLSVFIKAGLLEALIDVIATSDQYVSVRASMLLGELLCMASCYLPDNSMDYLQCLPTLIERAANFQGASVERHNASMALNCLIQVHRMRHRNPVPCSLFLDYVIRHASRTSRTQEPTVDMDSDYEVLNEAVRDCQVLAEDSQTWDWQLVSTILKFPSDIMRRLDDGCFHRFLQRLVVFFKPKNKMFSLIDLSKPDSRKMAVTGLDLADFLVRFNTEDTDRYAKELLTDVSECLNEVLEQHSTAHDAPFTSYSLLHTCCQFYFLIIGRFSNSAHGLRLLAEVPMEALLLKMLSPSYQDVYVKLVVSSLSYTRPSFTRTLLSRALTSTSDTARLYTTSLLRILLRTMSATSFVSWGIDLLVKQLSDHSKPVAMEALSILSEACEDTVYLENLAQRNLSISHLGDKAYFLTARFLSSEEYLQAAVASGSIEAELSKWHTQHNTQFVHTVEERLSEALTTYEKTYDGSYVRRSHRRMPRKDVFIPVHLYGQLVQHERGTQLLASLPYLPDLFDTLKNQQPGNDVDILKIKAALWAVGQIGRSVWGCKLLEENHVMTAVARLAAECEVFTIRGTAFFVLGLMSSTPYGADILESIGWESVRHARGHQRHKMIDAYLQHMIVSNFKQTFSTDELSESRSLAAIHVHRAADDSVKENERKLLIDRQHSSNGERCLDNQKDGEKSPCSSDKDVNPTSFFVAVDADLSSFMRRPKSDTLPSTMTDRDDGDCATQRRRLASVSEGIEVLPDEYLVPSDVSHTEHVLVSSHKATSNELTEQALCTNVPTWQETPQASLNGVMAARSLPNHGTSSPTENKFGLFEETVPGNEMTSTQSLILADCHCSKSNENFGSLQPITNAHDSGIGVRSTWASPNHNVVYRSSGGKEKNVTSAQDLHGYATLRVLNPYKGSTLDSSSRSLNASLFAAKTRSLDSRTSRVRSSLRNFVPRASFRDKIVSTCGSILRPRRTHSAIEKASTSFSAETEVGSLFSPTGNSLTPNVLQPVIGRAEYVGISLPCDISVMFQMADAKHTSNSQHHENSDEASSSCTCTVTACPEDIALTVPTPLLPANDLEHHSFSSCLGCYRVLYMPPSSEQQLDKAGITASKDDETLLTRREILQLVVKTSSSVGLKSCEQGLLILKQKFPTAFQDICLYSEICYLLANYNYRLTARRFIQELFQDVDFQSCVADPHRILGITDDDQIDIEELEAFRRFECDF